MIYCYNLQLKLTNKMKKLLLICLLIPSISFAQKHLEAANVFYDFFKYKEAIEEYELALKEEKTFKNEGYIWEHLALSYLYSFQYNQAARCFSELVKLGDGKASPDAYLNYGIVLKMLGNYEKAKEQFSYHAKLVKDAPYMADINRSLNWAIKNKDSIQSNVFVGLTNLDISGQSLGYCLFDDGIIYSQAKDSSYDKYTPLFDLRYAKVKDSVTFIPSLEYVDEITFPFNEGSPSITADGQTLVFTATAAKLKGEVIRKIGATEVSDEGVSNLKIYLSTLENGKFTNLTDLPFNNKQYNVTHPAISADGNTIIFVSDMPDGYGGLDLYKTTKQADGKWATPINLGDKVNTSENETYPFIYNNKLYFSSKGHAGFGGYDLFVSEVDAQLNPLNTKNMGKPFNSSKDDMALIRINDLSGYFSSNRDNGDGFDKVYYFNENYSKPVAPVLAVLPPKQDSVPAKIIAAATPKPVKSQPVVDKPKPAQKPVVAQAKTTQPATKPKPDVEQLPEHTFYYPLNGVELSATDINTLNAWIKTAKAQPEFRVQIVATADCRGSEEYNLQLSMRRALAIKKYMVQKGISGKRIIVIGLGEQEAAKVCANCEICSEEQHQQQRQVVVQFVD